MNVTARIPASHFGRAPWVLATTLWCCAVCIGMVAMARFDWTDGRRGRCPETWPTDSPLARAADRPTLVVALHPLCPCGRATIDLLAEFVAADPGRLDLLFLFLMTDPPDPAWAQAPAWNTAREIPGARVIPDPRGVESARLGALTSGHALLFDPQGRCLFSGGLTLGRGATSAGAGLVAIKDALRGRAIRFPEAPVFGCDLFAICEQCGPGVGEGRRP